MTGPTQTNAMLSAFDAESMRRARAENEVDRLNAENEALRQEIAGLRTALESVPRQRGLD